MQAEPLIHWPEPFVQLAGFLAEFLALGAVGFRYAAVRNRLRDTTSVDGAFYSAALVRAAIIGLVAQVVQALLFWNGLPEKASRAHTTAGALLTTNLTTGSEAVLIVLGLVGLAIAAARRDAGWPLAAIGVVLAPLTGVVSGQWARLVNPVHRVVAGLWIGTLFMLVVAGLVRLMRDNAAGERRGAIAADLVNGFSPLALTCGAFVVLSGIVTAVRHLNPFSSLWTTPYGYTLILKLCIVAVVFGLGAWNWRRVRPTLGTGDAAVRIRRSATGELAAAALVLAVTAILVSLPSPHPPGAGRPGGPGGPPPAEGEAGDAPRAP
jgi:putative copper export protein